MEYSAIYHDMDKRFCYAIDKDLFVIRVQVKKDDMKEIFLHCEDKYIPMECKDTRKTILMKKIATSQFHDYYEAQLQMHLICLRYYFEFTDTQGEKIYYGKKHGCRDGIKLAPDGGIEQNCRIQAIDHPQQKSASGFSILAADKENEEAP